MSWSLPVPLRFTFCPHLLHTVIRLEQEGVCPPETAAAVTAAIGAASLPAIEQQLLDKVCTRGKLHLIDRKTLDLACRVPCQQSDSCGHRAQQGEDSKGCDSSEDGDDGSGPAVS